VKPCCNYENSILLMKITKEIEEYCQCHEIYTERNLIDPNCQSHYIAEDIWEIFNEKM